MAWLLRKAPSGLEGRLAFLDSPAALAALKGKLPRQYLWIGFRSLERRSKDLADWRWMLDPLTPSDTRFPDLQ